MMRPEAFRVALCQRLPCLAHPWVRRLWRVLVWGFWLTYFGFVILVLALRYSILPNIESHRPVIERLVSQGLGQKVSIGRIEASWEGINPDLSLLDVRVFDAEGRPALAFSRIEAILSWLTVPSGKLKLRLLRIDEPTLNLRRDANGRVLIAGIPMSAEEKEGDISDWILAQRRIRISNATLVWEDELRKAPPLVLEELNLALDNDWRRHRFGLTALPPEGLASRIDVRGDFRGSDFEQLTAWSGTAYAEIETIDLAVWRQWIDYPVALPHGRGSLRAWVGFAEGALREITADFSFRDASLRLAKDLPSLDLEHMSGRLGAMFSKTGFSAKGKRIELEARTTSRRKGETGETIRIEPTDFHVEWRQEDEGIKGSGSATANRLDIAGLARLAEHLPLDLRSRRLLADYSPRGLIRDIALRWKGDAESLQTYSLQAGFEGMALKAQGVFPGFSGVTGTVEASEKGGSATVHSKISSIDLPSVFPESLIMLDELEAQARWKIRNGEVEAELTRVDFSGPEAAGSAQGTYRTAASGAGSIDLTASLSRADARAVWRYMPHVVGNSTRSWLRDSLVSGLASEARLTLKGNLDDFPFIDKSKGQFLVTVKAEDVVLDYGKGWPRLEGIHGNLRFEGIGMVVDAQRGTILGAKVSNTRAEIPDLDALDPIIIVKGQADGPTAEFLRFIDLSPVAERIDRFTEDMRATGNGHLDLALRIPLDEAKLGNSRVEGTYRFQNNEVLVDTALPPLRQVNGSVQFTGSDLRVPEITASLFGGPLKIKGGLQRDGRVLITANGSISVEQLRKQTDSPILASLSGTTPYRGEVRINKRNADLVIESDLLGLESKLPEPFRKPAGEPLPLRFEKKLLGTESGGGGDKSLRDNAPVRDQLSASLGQVLSFQLIRRRQAEGFAIERGVIAIGRPLQLPESGFSLGISAKRLDLDDWRRLMPTDSNAGRQGKATSPGMFPDALSLRTPELTLFGRRLDDADLEVKISPAQWKIRLASRQVSGDVLWETAGSGKLTARLKQLKVESARSSTELQSGEVFRELPALDVIAEDFLLGERRFGRLELLARNEAGNWMLNRVQMSNPFGVLSGNGQWQLGGGKNQTRFDFKVESPDVGKLLDRLGYVGAVSDTTAKLAGRIGWAGSPVAFDYDSLNGEMDLEAGKGRFLKLDPGAAGKLLGLISLQGLPRRITLDFKDVFSDGFAFDSIAGKLAVSHGVMQTDRLQIDGTSARVVMRGEVDLKRETQRLTVNVQPELGGTAALGVALINPIAGVATLLAHKVLQNPLNHMFGFDYLVTGKWDDPKVEKLTGSSPSAEPVPRLPTIPHTSGATNESSTK